MSPSFAQSSRLVIVANRLPVTVIAETNGVTVSPSAGGLVSGLLPRHEQGDGLWIGWPGDTSAFAAEQIADADAQLEARRLVPVHLSQHDVERFYHGFANRVLWPLFHYQVDRVPVDAADWAAYQHANEQFAHAVWREYRDGDTIWIHDYQLMLVPALIRAKLPHARIGFFLHIPFPSSEVFRVLPWRRQILEGLLGADLIGFHTPAYLRHFVSSLLHVDGVEADIDRVHMTGRDVHLGVYPMGIDVAKFADLAADPAVVDRAEEIRRDAAGRALILGVDRLDYTKGIPRRLHAIERVLASAPSLADSIRYIQVAVPSRGAVDSYQKFKQRVEQFVGQINGAFGTVRSVPVHYVHTTVSPKELVALYLAADVMLVTPLRDGMNLVAKEFVASRVDDDGVLILSEFAGAAAELDGAVVVNPYDVDAVARSITHALSMVSAERRARMRTLRRQVNGYDVHQWATSFVNDLLAARVDAHVSTTRHAGDSLSARLEHICDAPHVHLLLDYDGTLVPLARSPEAATPDDGLLALLSSLAATRGIQIDLVSGRPREPLEAWFGEMPIGLWAEHGFWHRAAPSHQWTATAAAVAGWQDRVLPILERFVASTPGSRIELKTASIAWHFRGAQREHGLRQAHELRMLLGTAFSNQPWGVHEGKKVVEIRLQGADKGIAGATVASRATAGTVLVAIGDERTDDDLFRSLPESSVRIAVGQESRCAPFMVDGYRDVRRVLRTILKRRASISSPSSGRRA